ncbi:type II secretion system protein E [Desulforamulus reducens MI-1]|uniref:Type II secretion system protein E n=1 Tax=Desulforamulus reducens (strain ATCC BAA-1160 / DSM 100696 / MI-1) TaxID=349161 RepID=A4J2N8_DESRM|nr:ATPase, T2SS/T4P/T4SS family [Desulforamulus reducens]ABO49341.1 type II secretion system protein E [Desulforamulus reducens MI-1]
MQKDQFKGLQGISPLLRQRQDQQLEEIIYSRFGELVMECRAHALTIFQKNKGEKIDGNYLESELNNLLSKKYGNIGLSERENIARMVKNEMLGYGVLQDLIDDPLISDIYVIRYNRVRYKRDGKLYVAKNVRFRDEQHLRQFIDLLCYIGKRKVDESNPTVSLTTPEGHRVAITLGTIADGFSTMSIRKFLFTGNIDGLVKNGTFSKRAAEFIRRCVKGRRNIVIVGPQNTGKTTLIAVLGHEFDENELPVLVEEVRECTIEHPDLRVFVARQANMEGKGEYGFKRILKDSLQSGGTRVLVAEVRDGSVYYMLTAMAMGQQGSMGTFHADSPQDAIQIRLVLMLSQAPECAGMTIESMYRIIGAAVHTVIMLNLDENGRRICSHISEVLKSTGEPPEVIDIFERRNGELVYTGNYPIRAAEEMKQYGVDFKGVIEN